jgi:hypothetical protein
VEKQGTEKKITLSSAAHAQAFQRLYQSRPNAKIEEWLSGRAMSILIIMAGDYGASMELLSEEAGSSRQTINKVLQRLKAAGVVAENENAKWNGPARAFGISDDFVENYAAAYADTIGLLMQKQARGFNVGLRLRMHMVVRTDAKSVPSYFCETGLSALARAGLEANLTSYSDYYFNLDGKIRKLPLEEKFIHAVLLSTLPQHAPDKLLLKLFLYKNRRKLDMGALVRLSGKYNVTSIFEEISRSADDYKTMREEELRVPA